MQGKRRPVVAVGPTGDKLEFPSMADAAREFGVTTASIHRAVSQGVPVKDHLFTSTDDWRDPAQTATGSRHCGSGRKIPIVGLSVTGRSVEFDSVTEAAEAFGVTISAVSHAIRRRSLISGYLLDYKDQSTPQSEPKTQGVGEATRKPKVPVVCLTTLERFSSAREATRYHGGSPAALLNAVESGRPYHGEFWFDGKDPLISALLAFDFIPCAVAKKRSSGPSCVDLTSMRVYPSVAAASTSSGISARDIRRDAASGDKTWRLVSDIRDLIAFVPEDHDIDF